MKTKSSTDALLIIALCGILFSCEQTKKTAPGIEIKDSLPNSESQFNPDGNEKYDESFQTHLKDTFSIEGNFVLFLRPDSARFESYADEDENVYDADSDFGFAISATTDSILKNRRYKAIHTGVSDKRFIVINDYKDGPTTFDRDSISYGLILTSKAKKIKIITNLHSGDYLQDVDEFFKISGYKKIAVE